MEYYDPAGLSFPQYRYADNRYPYDDMESDDIYRVRPYQTIRPAGGLEACPGYDTIEGRDQLTRAYGGEIMRLMGDERMMGLPSLPQEERIWDEFSDRATHYTNLPDGGRAIRRMHHDAELFQARGGNPEHWRNPAGDACMFLGGFNGGPMSRRWDLPEGPDGGNMAYREVLEEQERQRVVEDEELRRGFDQGIPGWHGVWGQDGPYGYDGGYRNMDGGYRGAGGYQGHQGYDGCSGYYGDLCRAP